MSKHVFEFYHKNTAPMTEAYNALRANIQFSCKGKEIKTLSVVSAVPYEGRTTVAINLAMSFANDGKKVLFLDTDLRKPGVAKKAFTHFSDGLTEYILGKASFDNIIFTTNIERMSYTSCGGRTPFPSEMLTSEEFDRFMLQVRNQFDYIILDTPSVNSVIDASILSAKADGTIMVISSGKTSHKNFSQAKDQLTQANANILGVVVNKLSKHEYNKYFDYYSRFDVKKGK